MPRPSSRATRRSARLLGLAACAIALPGCGAASQAAPGGGAVRLLASARVVATVRVVAAESFWGSIARQIGGARATVQSVIVNPAQDPHAYEPTPADARTLATARLAIVNGVGYDPWAPRLLAANPVEGRAVITVGSLFGLRERDNPHRWYDPAEVERVAQAIAAALTRLDPGQAPYFHRRLQSFQTSGLATYHALIAQIRSRYAGVPVGASESIFALLAPALGLDLVTPPSFMRAVSEGAELTAPQTAVTEAQITSHAIELWVYDTQNVTPEIQRCNGLARARGIPVATVTETLSPATASFEQWQVRQLRGIEAALHQATGR